MNGLSVFMSVAQPASRLTGSGWISDSATRLKPVPRMIDFGFLGIVTVRQTASVTVSGHRVSAFSRAGAQSVADAAARKPRLVMVRQVIAYSFDWEGRKA